MPSDIPEIDVRPARRTFWQRASVVWLVPIAALAVALGIAWQTWSSQGPVMVVTFDEALGVKARETELRYRDVTVGRVEDVHFTSDLGRVDVSIRVDKDIAAFVDEDAAFWVVRPEVSTRGVSGLDTVLSGVFIEGVWDTDAAGFVADHEGLDTAPLLRPGEEGLTISLRALPGTALSEGTAITYKGIEVGRVGRPEIRPGAAQAMAAAVIYAPYDRLISTTTRFWDTSGFSFSIGATGANLDFTSLASLIAGGVSFDTLVSGGRPVAGNAVFDLHQSEAAARAALFNEGRSVGVTLSIVFEENATGLAVGSPVQFNGIGVGEVKSVAGLVEPDRFGDQKVRLLVNIEVDATLLGLADDTSEETVLDFFEAQTEAGLRARLATASILTGGLRVELITVANAAPARLDRGTEPYPTLPSTESVIADAGATAQGMLKRVNDLPIEELMQAAIDLMENSTTLVTNGALAQIPEDVRAILGDLRNVTGSEEIQAVPEQFATILADLQSAAGDLRGVIAQINEAQAVDRLLGAIDAAGAAAEAVSGSMDGVPELVASLTATADTARALPLDALTAQATDILASAQAIIDDPGARDIPGTLNAALAEMRQALADLRAGGAVEKLLAAIDNAALAASDVSASTVGVPDLIASLTATAETARALPLDALVARASEVVASADALLAAPGTRDLPATLNASLGELRLSLEELREGGAVENLNETLASAQSAAAAIEAAANDLPGITTRLNEALERASATLEGIDGNSELNRSARQALSEVSRAAKAVESLARTLERQPNSIILGR